MRSVWWILREIYDEVSEERYMNFVSGGGEWGAVYEEVSEERLMNLREIYEEVSEEWLMNFVSEGGEWGAVYEEVSDDRCWTDRTEEDQWIWLWGLRVENKDDDMVLTVTFASTHDSYTCPVNFDRCICIFKRRKGKSLYSIKHVTIGSVWWPVRVDN